MVTRLAYILAASHSGSTLLSMLLGSHPQIATVGEMSLSPAAMGVLDHYRCSCGVPIRQCHFWKEVKDGMAKRGLEFDLACADTDYRTVASLYAARLLRPLHRRESLECIRNIALWLSPTWRKRLPETHRRNAALASVVSEITKAKVVVDSSKVGLRLKYLLRNPEIDVKVIRLLRDGRAVALTYMNPAGFADAADPTRRGGGMGGNREKERLSMAQAAYEWGRCIEEAEHLLSGLERSQWIEVRYEEYCQNPTMTLSRLYEFLGVEPARELGGFRVAEQHVVGNGMRLDTTSEIRLDERWRENLSEQDLRIFDDVAGRMNRRQGYE